MASTEADIIDLHRCATCASGTVWNQLRTVAGHHVCLPCIERAERILDADGRKGRRRYVQTDGRRIIRASDSPFPGSLPRELAVATIAAFAARR